MSEAETWYPTKRNVLLTRTIPIDDVDYTYRYYIDDDAEVHIVGRYKIINIHERNSKYGNKIESDLLRLLKCLDIDRDTAVEISILAETDENRQELIWAICDRYEEKGTVTKQDVLKLLLIITGCLKTSTENTSKQ